MKKEYIDTPFGNLIVSYARLFNGLSVEEIEKGLRVHAKQWSGCISCRYSLCYYEENVGKRNVWLVRRCQLGLKQDNCEMHEEFPEKGGE